MTATRIRLSERERQVVQRILEGHTYLEIGKQLGISEKTVNAHVQAIAARLPGPGKPNARIVRHGERILAA